MGDKLNDYWAKGPNMINDLFGVLIQFCIDYVAMTNNVLKMHNTDNLSPLDQDSHQFLWRIINHAK